MVFTKITVLCCLIAQLLAHPVDFPEEGEFRISSLFELQDEITNKEEYRLSDKLWPSHYDVKLTPHFEEVAPGSQPFTFDGQVIITFQATDREREIVLHANNLEIDNASWDVRNPSGAELRRGQAFTYQEETHKVTFPLDVALDPNVNYKITINYKGHLDDTMRGFYRSYYNEASKVKWLGTTQFQSTDARRAMPCFDEPKYKATFSLVIIRPAGYQPTIANTKISETKVVAEGVVEDHFAITPVMSSYLIAFIVSMYQGVQTADKSYGVYARPEAGDQKLYAFEVGQQLLQKMGEWVDYPYNNVPEIQKLDMIAIPDFSAGGKFNP